MSDYGFVSDKAAGIVHMEHYIYVGWCRDNARYRALVYKNRATHDALRAFNQCVDLEFARS